MKSACLSVFAVSWVLLGFAPSGRLAGGENDDPARPPAITVQDVPVVPPELMARLRGGRTPHPDKKRTPQPA